MLKLKIFAAAVAVLVAASAAQAQQSQDPAMQAGPEGAPREESKTCEYKAGPFLKLLQEWRTQCHHPLCGQVYAGDPARVKKSAKPCDAEVWLSMKDDMKVTILSGGAVLFGEEHDNPLHHELRSRVGMSNFGSVVLEQINQDQSAALDKFMAENSKNANESTLAPFKEAIGWDKSGWASYKYDPLLRSILLSHMPLYAGDASRETIKKVAKDGEGVLAVDERKRLKLDVPLGEKNDAASIKELTEHHCGMIPSEGLRAMAFAQRYRDAVLADTVLKAIGQNRFAVLFAGNGHIRTDRGVPWYIHAADPAKKTLSIMLVEVEEGKTDPAAYVPRDPDGKAAVDYLIFTPRAEREDPCKKMREQKKD